MVKNSGKDMLILFSFAVARRTIAGLITCFQDVIDISEIEDYLKVNCVPTFSLTNRVFHDEIKF